MFSRRSSWDLKANRLARAVEQRKRREERIIDLTQSNPTQAGLAYPEEEIREILFRAASSLYRPEPMGLPEAREAVKQYYAERGIELEAGQILLTASTSEAYGFLFKLLADPGDGLLAPRPSYPLFEFLAGLEGLELRTYPLRLGEKWAIDLDRTAAETGGRTRVIALVHPNNPTGSFVKRKERAAIEALAQECGLSLISDEVFADYGVDEDVERVPTFAGEAGVPTFVLNGLSKVLGLPQLKLSWIVAQGPEEVRRKALARLEVIADTYLSVGTAVQQALPELLALRPRIQAQIRSRIRKNLGFLQVRTAGVENTRLLPYEGGWYAVLETEDDGEETALSLLEEQGVLVHPGYFFDFAHSGFLVLSLLSREFEEGVERLVEQMSGRPSNPSGPSKNRGEKPWRSRCCS